MSKWKAVIALVVIFATGAVSGWFVSLHQFQARLDRLRSSSPAMKQEMILGKMQKHLRLTPEQREVFEKVIGEAVRKNQAIRRDGMRQVAVNVDQAMEQLMPILSPQQQKRLRKRQEKRRKRMLGSDR